MPASKANYIVLYTNSSQIYGAASKETALASPPPKGSTIEEKRVLFITFEPDNEVISVHPVPQEEVLNAPMKTKEDSNVQED